MEPSKWISLTAGALALAGTLVMAGHRYLTTEEKVYVHETVLERVTTVQEELAEAALAENAKRATRNEICKALREAGKIRKGECPRLED